MPKYHLYIFTALSLAAVGGAIMSTTKPVFAQTDMKYPPIVQKMIDKFNLNTGEVDKLMEEEKTERDKRHQEMEAQRQKDIETLLNKAVSDKKITSDQKTKILAKLAEMKASRPDKPNREEMMKLTVEERQKKFEEMEKVREQRKTELEAWEKEVGVNLKDLIGSEMGPMGHGPHGPRGHHPFGF